MLADDAAIVCYLTAGPTFLFLDGINLAPCSICHHRAFPGVSRYLMSGVPLNFLNTYWPEPAVHKCRDDPLALSPLINSLYVADTVCFNKENKTQTRYTGHELLILNVYLIQSIVEKNVATFSPCPVHSIIFFFYAINRIACEL